MDRGAWQATVHGVTRVGHDLVTKPPPPPRKSRVLSMHTTPPKGWADCLSHPSGPTPQHTLTFTPYKEPAPPLRE